MIHNLNLCVLWPANSPLMAFRRDQVITLRMLGNILVGVDSLCRRDGDCWPTVGNEDKIVIYLYLKCNPYFRGYRPRMVIIWGETFLVETLWEETNKLDIGLPDTKLNRIEYSSNRKKRWECHPHNQCKMSEK